MTDLLSRKEQVLIANLSKSSSAVHVDNKIGVSFRDADNISELIIEDGDKIIVLCHYPPFNARREDSLYTNIFEENNVNAVIYGHLHGKAVKADKLVYKKGITYYLTSCDQVNNMLTEIEI